MRAEDLLESLKANLVLEHDKDDMLLLQYLSSAISYAEGYQKKGAGYYQTGNMLESTKQGVIIMATHFYESRDGSTAGFFADTTDASRRVWETCHLLFQNDKDVIL